MTPADFLQSVRGFLGSLGPASIGFLAGLLVGVCIGFTIGATPADPNKQLGE